MTTDWTVRTILADPPWTYADKLRQSETLRGSGDQYDVMSVEEICSLSSIYYSPDGSNHDNVDLQLCSKYDIEDEAFLWLWVTNSFLLDGSGVRVARAWGFEPKQIVTWVKTKQTHVYAAELATENENIRADFDESYVEDLQQKGLQMGMGRLTRAATEQMIVATRGRYTQHVKAKNRRNVIFAPRGGHSEKPEQQYDLIEAICPGPYLELFARKQRPGWTAWGKDLK